MSRAAIVRAVALACLVLVPGGTVAGQSKPAPKRPAASAPEKTAAPKRPADSAPEKNAAPKAAPAPADLMARTRFTTGAQVSEITTYVKGTRQRVEFPGVVSIEQCDAGQTLVLNPVAKTYFVTKHSNVAAEAASASPTAPRGETDATAPGQQKPSGGGLVTYTTTVNDTGERKQVFGREARRIANAITKDASASACDKSAMTVEVDGWYVDVPRANPCARGVSPAPPPRLPADACVDQVETRTIGTATLGFPIAMTTTTKTGDGDKQVTTMSMEVTALEVTTLDAALFEVPAGYTQVQTGGELMSGFKGEGGLSRALLGSTADGTSTAAPKTAGAIRIGVLEPVDKSTHNLPTSELRQELAAHFHTAPFEALALVGHGVAESRAEAERLQCDYVLSSEVADIKTSRPGKLGGMLKKVSGEGAARDVHEVRLVYTLYRVGTAAPAPAFTDSAKASSGGGFGLRAALRVAASAGSLYLRFSGLGALSPLLMSGLGVGGLGALSGTGLYDPRISAMASMTQLLATTGVDATRDHATALTHGAASTVPAQADIRRTVDLALATAARGTMEQVNKNIRK